MNVLRRKLIGMIGGNSKNIPDDYQQVEYIQSTGTQWIDTGVLAKSNQSAKMDFEFTTVGNDVCVLGVRQSTNRLYFMHSYPSVFCLGYGMYYSSNTGIVENTRYKTETLLYIDNQRITVNGVVVLNRNLSTSIETDLTYHLFGMNLNGKNVYRSQVKLYGCSISDKNDGFLAVYIPCYRKVDGVIGLYDSVSKRFLTNSGSGVFLKGADVNVS